MDNVNIDTSFTVSLTLPVDPTGNSVSVSLYHELGSLPISTSLGSRQSTGVYQVTYGQGNDGVYILNSCGIYRAVFTYTISGVTNSQFKYINVYSQYVDSATFFDTNPTLIDKFEYNFDSMEEKCRKIINTYCGQSFDFFNNISISLDAIDSKVLYLPIPICTLKTVIYNIGETDEELLHDKDNVLLNNMEKVRQFGGFESSRYIRFKNKNTGSSVLKSGSRKFYTSASYTIKGDFGWPYVPTNVSQAATLLIADLMNDDSELRRHGISNISMDNVSFSTNQNFYETTGNIEADILLMDYQLFIMDYIV